MAGALAAAAVLTTGCVVASPDSDTYADAASLGLGTAASDVATVETMLRLLDAGKISRPFVVAQLRYNEKSLSQASQDLGSLNPPPDQDTLAKDASEVFDDAEGAVEDARVAVHRRKTSDYVGLADNLADVAARIEQLEKGAS